MAVSLTQAQKYRRGLLPTLTYTGSTFARPGKIPKQSPLQDYRRTAFGGGGGGAAAAPKPTTFAAPNVGLAQNYYQQLGGGTPDYSALIGGDWEVQAAEGAMQSQMQRARGAFKERINQALIDLGVTDRSKLGSLGSYIDENTITQAAANKYSRTAQTAQKLDTAQRQSEAALAARGMLGSGQLVKTNEDLISEAEGQRYSDLRDFLSGGQEGLYNLADMEGQLAAGVAQARAAAAARAAEMYQIQNANRVRNQLGGYVDYTKPFQGAGSGVVPYNPQAPSDSWGIQDMINLGYIDWESVGNLGYERPPWAA